MARVTRHIFGDMSITTRTAILLSALVGAIFIIAGILAFRDTDHRARIAGLANLDHYARQVARQQDERFARIRAVHQRATQLLRAELATNPTLGTPATFDSLFAPDPRGGRRSVPALFDGGVTPMGYVRGVGAIVPGEPDPQQRRMLSAAVHTVHALGEAVHPGMESLYLFTPRNDLVIFAPARSDRLNFYRKDAPPDFDFQKEELATIVTPAANPARAMRCTALRHILSDRKGGTWTTGCMTPVDLGGRHVAAWGTSILLDQLMLAHDFDDIRGADVILISREGRLIYHPGYTRQAQPGPESLLDLTRTADPALQALWRFVRESGNRPFLGEAPAIDSFVALRRIEATGWYVLVRQDRAVLHADTWRTVGRIAMTALVCLVLQALAIFLLMRWQVGVPLQALIERTRLITRRTAPARFVERERLTSPDEVVQLTHDFDLMAERVLSTQDELERKVALRTDALRNANKALKVEATRDPLTGIPNRRHLMTEIEARLAVLGPDDHYLLAIDIDQFDRINAEHGRAAGDAALTQVANGIVALLRDGDLCGRMGGGEIVALIRASSQADAMAVAERVRFGVTMLESPGRHGAMIRMTVSVGVARARDGDGCDSLYARADAALCEAKQRGRDRIFAHVPDPRPIAPPDIRPFVSVFG